MPSKRDRRSQIDFQSLLKEHFSKGAEVRDPAEGDRLTVPSEETRRRFPNAGISVGWVQRDLSKSVTDRQTIVNFLARDPVLGKEGNRFGFFGRL